MAFRLFLHSSNVTSWHSVVLGSKLVAYFFWEPAHFLLVRHAFQPDSSLQLDLNFGSQESQDMQE